MKLLPCFAAILVSALAPRVIAGSFADLSVYDRIEGKRLTVHWHEGRAYVAGKPGNEYHVSVRNRRGEDLLAVVSVDGVNVVSGETADPSQGGYVLSPHHSLDIQGWRKSLSETAAFYFTALPDSYAARTARPEHVGVIGVALFRRKPVQAAPREGRPELSREKHSGAGAADAARSAEAAAPLGTGHGRRETTHARQVAFERATLTPVETLMLYYDSHRNLVARGVLRPSVPLAPLPRPFPGFVADPA